MSKILLKVNKRNKSWVMINKFRLLVLSKIYCSMNIIFLFDFCNKVILVTVPWYCFNTLPFNSLPKLWNRSGQVRGSEGISPGSYCRARFMALNLYINSVSICSFIEPPVAGEQRNVVFPPFPGMSHASLRHALEPWLSVNHSFTPPLVSA